MDTDTDMAGLTPEPSPTPQELDEICDNGQDDDNDGQVDGADSDCADQPPPTPGQESTPTPTVRGLFGSTTLSPSPSPTPTPAPSPSPSPSPSPTSTPTPNALLDALRRQSIVANPTPDCVVGGVGLDSPDCNDFAQFVQTCSDVPGPEGLSQRNVLLIGTHVPRVMNHFQSKDHAG